MKFRVIITGRNTEQWVTKCLESVLSQRNIDQLVVDWTDDASTDNTRKAEVLADERIRVTTRDRRVGAVENIYHAIHRAFPDEICVLMGGDDWLSTDTALERIAYEYANPDVWLTYGQQWPFGGHAVRARVMDHDNARNHDFVWVNPLTWRAPLAQKIRAEDLQMGGFFLPSSGDVALTIPMVEMAGLDRIRCIDDVIYFYNVHDQNDGMVDKRLQDWCGWYARSKPRYHRLARLEDAPTLDSDEKSPLEYGILCMPHSADVAKTCLSYRDPTLKVGLVPHAQGAKL